MSTENEDVFDAIGANHWQQVRDYLKDKRFLSSFSPECTNAAGFNAFHMTCLKREVPEDVIQSMVQLNRGNLLSKTRNEGATALHLSCESGSIRTVKTLVDLMSGFKECFAGKRLLSMCDDREAGYTPIDVIWRKHADPNYISYRGARRSANIAARFVDQLSSVSTVYDMCRDANLKRLWTKTCILLMNLSPGDDLGFSPQYRGTWSILFSILSCDYADDCPQILLWLILRLFPEQARWKSDMDDNNDTLLHMLADGSICKQFVVYDLPEMSELDDIVKEMQMSTTELLLMHYPEAAITPNNESRLPLHCVCDRVPHARYDPEDVDELIKTLIGAAPETVNK